MKSVLFILVLSISLLSTCTGQETTVPLPEDTTAPAEVTTLDPGATTAAVTQAPDATTPAGEVTTANPVTEIPTTVAPTTAAPFQCTTQGKFPDPSDCTIYYQCMFMSGTWYKYKYTCPNSSVFCDSNKLCNANKQCGC